MCECFKAEKDINLTKLSLLCADYWFHNDTAVFGSTKVNYCGLLCFHTDSFFVFSFLSLAPVVENITVTVGSQFAQWI